MKGIAMVAALAAFLAPIAAEGQWPSCPPEKVCAYEGPGVDTRIAKELSAGSNVWERHQVNSGWYAGSLSPEDTSTMYFREADRRRLAVHRVTQTVVRKTGKVELKKVAQARSEAIIPLSKTSQPPMVTVRVDTLTFTKFDSVFTKGETRVDTVKVTRTDTVAVEPGSKCGRYAWKCVTPVAGAIAACAIWCRIKINNEATSVASADRRPQFYFGFIGRLW